MKSAAALILAALAAIAQAVQFDFDNSGFAPIIGEPVTLSFSGASPGSTVTITLKDGPSGDLQDVEVVATVEAGPDGTGSFVWTPSGLPSDTYALEISDGSDVNYSPQFTLAGDVTATSSVASSTTTESTTTSTTETSSTITTESSTITSASNSSSTLSTSTSKTTEATTTSADDAAETTEPVNQNGSGRLGASVGFALGLVGLIAFLN